MSGYLYEKDLAAMKYAILISSRHDRMVREIAEDIAVSPQKVRKHIIERFDMLLLENLPARYYQGKLSARKDPPLDRALRRTLYTRAVPIIDDDRLGEIHLQVRKMIADGIEEDQAAERGRKMIGEVLFA